MRKFAFVLCLVSASLVWQVNYATLGGTITDPQGKAFAGAEVECISSSTHAVRHVRSNDEGIFEITDLPPGDYELKVHAPGFSPLSSTVSLEVSQNRLLNLSFRLASVRNVVEVGDTAPALHPTDSSVGEVIESVAVHDLPLNGRMLIDLMLTVPGSPVSHGAQTGNMDPVYWRLGQRSAVSIGGNRPNANYFLLDGTTDTDPTFNTLNLSPSPDAVQELKVATGSYSAAMGARGEARSGSSRVPALTHFMGLSTSFCATVSWMRLASRPWETITWSRITMGCRSAALSSTSTRSSLRTSKDSGTP